MTTPRSNELGLLKFLKSNRIDKLSMTINTYRDCRKTKKNIIRKPECSSRFVGYRQYSNSINVLGASQVLKRDCCYILNNFSEFQDQSIKHIAGRPRIDRSLSDSISEKGH